MTAVCSAAPLAWTLLAAASFAQGTKADYKRAAALPDSYEFILDEFQPAIRWLPDGSGVFWKNLRKPGYTRVFVATGAREETALITDWGLSLSPQILPPTDEWKPSVDQGGEVQLKFENRLPYVVRLYWIDRGSKAQARGEIQPGSYKIVNTYSGHSWVVDRGINRFVGLFTAGDLSARCIIDPKSVKLAQREWGAGQGAEDRVSLWIADHRVAMRDEDGTSHWLSRDGDESDPYLDEFHYSPDGKQVLTYQATAVPKRYIRIPELQRSESSKTTWESVEYPVAGDLVSHRRPRVFDLIGKWQVPIDDTVFQDAYRTGWSQWSKSSAFVYCMVVDRGHQRVRVLSIDVETGRIKTLVEELSETFIDSWNKTTLFWLESSEQFIWASERDGHNHLYLYDARTGELVRQLTRGDYVVREIDHVDEIRGEVWFTAYGIHPDQNPTYAHLARVDLEGSEPVKLTEGNGTHQWRFNADRTLFLDRWSRIDQPEVTELRRARDGSLVAELGRDRIQNNLRRKFHTAEPFSAAGRDGSTPIYGIIIRPSNFDAQKKYPVLEKINASPHDHHVPNAFTTSVRERKLAELGFIVVQIDGMGTNWRSKKFHDVCWQNLKDAGLPDRIAWMKAAAEKYPELDLDRVGIYGGSAGGQSALAAMLHHGDFYDAAAADCGSHDNRVDKLWWNEAWMGKLGPHYAENSNVTHARKLRGDLLLTVGLSDRYVDPACTMLVVDALIAAGKDFEFLAVPGGEHGVGDWAYPARRRQDFFVRSLLGVEPRR